MRTSVRIDACAKARICAVHGEVEFVQRGDTGHGVVFREKARAEAQKCVLLCANCHAEVEAGVLGLP
jgi:hypothetical protein